MFRTEAVHVVLLAFSHAAKFLDMVSFFSSFYYTAHPFKPACSELYSFLPCLLYAPLL